MSLPPPAEALSLDAEGAGEEKGDDHHHHQQQAQSQQQEQQQPRDLTGVVAQLASNADAIASAEEQLRGLLARQAALHRVGRKLEQHQVLAVLQAAGAHLGFDRGRPVAAVLLYRCLQHWGLLHQTEPCPFLEQLAGVLQDTLDSSDDASAPAEVAGLQCHVANSLSLCAVLYCVLLKASHPELAAAAAAAADGHRGPKQGVHASAAEVVAAARKKVSATWQQGMAHVGPGLQALGKLKLGGWGFKRPDEPSAAAAAAVGSRASSTSSSQVLPQPDSAEQMQEQQSVTHAASTAHATEADEAAALADSALAAPHAALPEPAALHQAAPLGAFLLCLDFLVQHAYVLLRDQLKRRLTPLLADCISPPEPGVVEAVAAAAAEEDGAAGSPSESAAAAAAGADAATGKAASPTAAGAAAIAGSAAESPAHAAAALESYRSWSELVGVLHAALVALRAAHVPRSLRAQLMQQMLEFIDVNLTNQLLLRPECCSISNAQRALRGLKQLDSWIIAEQSAAHPHVPASAGAGGSVHNNSSGSFNSQAAPATGSQQGGSGGGGGGGAAAAAAAAAEDEDGGWEQVVPADAGEFDSWQPAKQQQMQQPWWRQLTHQQQQQHGSRAQGEQPELGPEAWNALAHVRQALQFLVFEDKSALGLEDLTDHVCPALNHQQLYRLCTTAWSEEPDAAPGGSAGVTTTTACGVSGEVLEQMQQLHHLSNNGGLIVTFLLDEPSGPLPFLQRAAAPAAAAAAPSAATRCRLGAVVQWDDGRDFGAALRPASVPAALVGDEVCPAEVFAFLAVDQAWPPGTHNRA